MPIVNDTSDNHLKNSLMPANADEAPKSQGYCRDVMRGAGVNASMPANTWVSRFTQESGTH